ncbi:MAG: YtxH domain-containing protein [Aquificae bacterium]|nr:YtxH domain-containing protein [Aquificota bacterium]
MKKGALLLVTSVLGAVGAYFAYKRKDEILQKLNELQEALKEAELTDKAKTTIGEVIDKITGLIKREDEMTEEEKVQILKEVEEKIKKLEEVVKAEKEA